MLPNADFESRFFAALAGLGSLLLHAIALLLFLSGSHDEPARNDVVLEIVRAPPASAESAAPTEREGAPLSLPPPLEAPAEMSADEETGAGGGYRERLRRREALFEKDMELRRRRVALLEQHHASAARDGGVRSGAEQVHACGAHDPGDVVPVVSARPMTRYADVVPVGLFPPRYLDEVVQVRREGGGSLGRVEMALPPRDVVIQLDAPSGAIFAVGRRDVSCLVGFSWSREVFPLHFRGLPARYVGPDDVVREVLMDVVLHEDASFDVTVRDGDALGFTSGVLYDRDAVARNLEQRATGARLVRDFLGALFGG